MSFSLDIKKSNTDEWYTPKETVELIVPYLKERGFNKILCPFDKVDSNFVLVLRSHGFDVTYSHIDTGTDFFMIDDFSKYDAVVSNPPFSKREAILKKLFSVGVPFAMVMNFNGIFDSTTRFNLFKSNRFEILVPCGRVKFFNEDCEGHSPQFQSVYVTGGVLDRQIVFEETNRDQMSIFDFLGD